MPDQLVIHDLVAECRIGVQDWEQERPQRVWIDLILEIDAASAAARDEVRFSVDYAQLVAVVRKLVEGTSYRLLETMAEQVAAAILGQFKTRQVFVRIKKRVITGVDYAAVELTRRATVRAPTRRGRGRVPTRGRVRVG